MTTNAKKRSRRAGETTPAQARSDDRLDRVEILKKMCRTLEVRRRDFLESVWRDLYSGDLPQQQFNHLMMLRFSLPCNLHRVMMVTGLSSAGASILVNKLVQFGLLKRQEDPSDRRNIIDFTLQAKLLVNPEFYLRPFLQQGGGAFGRGGENPAGFGGPGNQPPRRSRSRRGRARPPRTP